MAEKLARRKQIAPQRHTILNGAIVIAYFGKPFTRHHVERFPLRQFLIESRSDFGAVVVFGSGYAVAANPFWLAPFTGFQEPFDAPSVNNGIQLLTHTASLSLSLDLVAVDNPPAIGIRAGAVAARHRAGRLLSGRVDDLECTEAARGTCVRADTGPEPDPGAVGGQPPIRRERHEAIAIGAGDGACPEIALNADPFGFRGENTVIFRLGPLDKFMCKLVKGFK